MGEKLFNEKGTPINQHVHDEVEEVMRKLIGSKISKYDAEHLRSLIMHTASNVVSEEKLCYAAHTFEREEDE